MAARRIVPPALDGVGARHEFRSREGAAVLLSALLTLTLLARIVAAQEPISTPTPAVWPVLLLTEVMADPHATADKEGEWFEVHNPGAEAVNLLGWFIGGAGEAQHPISMDVWIDPGAYAVFARSGDPARNGGVYPVYVYADLELANAEGALRLLAPDSQEIARLSWGDGAGPGMTQGASLERVGNPPVATGPGIEPGIEEVWAAAHSPWPGSAGDLGSPGAPYAPPPTATPTPEPTATATATPLPTETAALVLTATPTIPDTPPRLRLSELMANPAAVSDEMGEWIEIVNLDASSVNLNGWTLADLDRDRHRIAVDLWLQPGEYAVLARSGDSAANGGVTARYVYADLQLANESDELLLITPWGVEADRVVWPEMGAIVGGASLERVDPWANVWVVAQTPWDGSAGDFGSPGAPYTPPPTPTPTAVPTPYPDTPPPLVISEIMADPSAVGDDVGEWFEVHNAGAEPVDLRDWQLADLGSDAHTIAVNVVIQPGEYAVFARSADATINGGVYPYYVYSGLTLANQDDELLLITPWGVEVSRAVWGDQAGIRVRAGASLERTSLGAEAVWAYAGAPWPGSAGDLGSPGFGYFPAPTPLPTAAPPGIWVRAAAPSALVIEEVYARGSDTEFIALHNHSGAPVSLAGWLIGDAESAGREGLYALPEHVSLAPNSIYVIARSGAAFRALWGHAPDAEIQDSDPLIPDLIRRGDLASGQLALDDGGDE